jgi:hypothetical protein
MLPPAPRLRRTGRCTGEDAYTPRGEGCLYAQPSCPQCEKLADSLPKIVLIPLGFLVIAGFVWNAGGLELSSPCGEFGAERGCAFGVLGDEILGLVGVASEVEEEFRLAAATEIFPLAFADRCLIPEAPAELFMGRSGILARQIGQQVDAVERGGRGKSGKGVCRGCEIKRADWVTASRGRGTSGIVSMP